MLREKVQLAVLLILGVACADRDMQLLGDIPRHLSVSGIAG
jgi:hypothetical protein